MTEEREFANTPDAVAQARRFVADQLSDVRRDIADEVAIMVSELATNCVRHTVTDFTVRVDTTGGEIRVEVTDSGGGEPQIRDPDMSEPSGRGLRIVQELSDSFGIEALRGSPGKTVWFVVRLEDHGSGAPTKRAMSDGSDEPPSRDGRGESGGRDSGVRRHLRARGGGSGSRPETSCRRGIDQAGFPASRSRTRA